MNKTGAFVAGCLLTLTILGAGLAQAGGFPGWEHGPSGHERALAAAERAHEPLVVYFRVEWCKWCRRLNENYLGSGPVRDVLMRMQKVEINPEDGRAHEALFKKYGGSGFPSFYVLVPGSGEQPLHVSPFLKSRDDLSAVEFAGKIQGAASSHFDRWAHRLYKAGDNEQALEVLNHSLSFNPRNAYAYSMRGLIYHETGHERRDVELLRKAKAAYEQALQLDPGQMTSRRGLEVLGNL